MYSEMRRTMGVSGTEFARRGRQGLWHGKELGGRTKEGRGTRSVVVGLVVACPSASAR